MNSSDRSSTSYYPTPQQLAYYPNGHRGHLFVQPDTEPPPRQARSGRKQLILGIAAGLILGAGVTAGLALTGTFGSVRGAADTTAISVPTSVTGLVVQDESALRDSTISLDRAAYGGAAADVQVFLDSSGATVVVHAIRAPAPGLALGLAADTAAVPAGYQPTQIMQYGDVQCEISTGTSGSDRSSVTTASRCQRTDGSLTVQVWAPDGSVDSRLAVVNEVWNAVR